MLTVAGTILQAAPADPRHPRRSRSSTRDSGRERIGLAEIARIAYFRPDTLPPGFPGPAFVAHHYVPRKYPFAFTNGVQACYLEVDVETGFIKLLKQWVVEDCGRIINPLLVDEQIRGGVVQGLGAGALRAMPLRRERPAH